MSVRCVLPEESGPGCCAEDRPEVAVRPQNDPGLSSISYRVGGFGSFRRIMLRDLGELLPAWRPSVSGDHATMILELWAYVADVLTFYQERIANEAYIRTATRRDSLIRLAELVGHRVDPGAAATALVAFTLAKGASATIPPGTRVASRAAASRPSAIFETEAAVAGVDALNAVALAVDAPAAQFADLGALTELYGPHGSSIPADAAAHGAAIAKVFPGLRRFLAPTQAAAVRQASAQSSVLPRGTRTRTFIAHGIGLRIRPGDYLLLVPVPAAASTSSELRSNEGTVFGAPTVHAGDLSIVTSKGPVGTSGATPTVMGAVLARAVASAIARGELTAVGTKASPAAGDGELRAVVDVREDRTAKTTFVTFAEARTSGVDYVYPSALGVFALRTIAAPFGANAPRYADLAAIFHSVKKKAYPKNWDEPKGPAAFVPGPKEAGATLHLDRTYDGIGPATDAAPSWAVLLDTASGTYRVFRVERVDTATFSDYTLNNRVTRVTLAPAPKGVAPRLFPLRSTAVLLQPEPLALVSRLPLPRRVSGRLLLLAGRYPDLLAGKPVIVRGASFDAPAEVRAEDAVIDKTEYDAATDMTAVTLRAPLARSYERSSTALLANVAAATHGETVSDEILGSGDSSPWQRFTVRKAPLTYAPPKGAAADVAVESSLRVRVNGLQWKEAADLADSGTTARVYTTRLEESGKTVIEFGDGVTGARPPTGRDNVRARYRWGSGSPGDVGPDAIAQPVDSVPGVQGVTNPMASFGAADPETSEQIRSRAPAGVATLGRAVSVGDYSALTRSFPGIARARAGWVRAGGVGSASTAPTVRVTVATTNGKPLRVQPEYARRLRRFLDNSRDPNVPLQIVDLDPVYVDVAATIDVHDDRSRSATLAAVSAALNPKPNPDGTLGFFAALDFGVALHLSALYAVLQGVPGVRRVLVTTFRRVDARPSMRDPAGTVREHIAVSPTQLVMVGDDPDDTQNTMGKIVIELGQGGYIE